MYIGAVSVSLKILLACFLVALPGDQLLIYIEQYKYVHVIVPCICVSQAESLHFWALSNAFGYRTVLFWQLCFFLTMGKWCSVLKSSLLVFVISIKLSFPKLVV